MRKDVIRGEWGEWHAVGIKGRHPFHLLDFGRGVEMNLLGPDEEDIRMDAVSRFIGGFGAERTQGLEGRRLGVKVDLFPELPRQGSIRRFPGADLAARLHEGARPALAHEERLPVGAEEQCGGDADCGQIVLILLLDG